MKVHDAARGTIASVMTNTGANVSPILKSHAKIYLLKALQTYDPTKGVKLSTHIYSQLRPLQREVFSHETLYVPERIRYDMGPVNRAQSELEEELGRSPNDEEVADRAGVSVKLLNRVRSYNRPAVYESKLIAGEDNKGYLPGVQSSTADIMRGLVYGSLGATDKAIVDLKLGANGEPMSVTDIAHKVGLSPGAVSQRMEKIERRISELETSHGR